MLNPGLHPVIKAELPLVVANRHLPTYVLIVLTHLLGDAVDIRALGVNVGEFSLACFSFGSPDDPLGMTFCLVVDLFSYRCLIKFLLLAQFVLDFETLTFVRDGLINIVTPPVGLLLPLVIL